MIVPPSAAQAPAGSDLRFLYENQKNFPEGPERLATNIRRIGIHRVLFATDWPHWQFDGTDALPPGLSPALVQRIMVDNPRETYPRLKETVA